MPLSRRRNKFSAIGAVRYYGTAVRASMLVVSDLPVLKCHDQATEGCTMAARSHILVVEDDPLVSDVVVDALDEIYHTSRAETAAAAMECLRAGGIDAMLLDCTLPGGVDPNLMPLADRSGIPVILMSGHPEMIERIAAGPRPWLLKPFTLSTLLSTIEQVVPHD
jgi:DNA-binding NtrC family response regulator